MKRTIILIALFAFAGHAQARSIEENVLAFYPDVVETLNRHGFEGPFGHEVARMALVRQIIEDGAQRDHSKSMVGMVPGGINRKVVRSLGLEPGATNVHGYKLTTVPAHDGQRSYAIYGPRANVLSVAAIALVWERYVNELQCFDDADARVWNQAKVISRKIAEGNAKPQAKVHFRNVLREKRHKLLRRVNRIYGSNAAGVVVRLAKEILPLCGIVCRNVSDRIGPQ